MSTCERDATHRTCAEVCRKWSRQTQVVIQTTPCCWWSCTNSSADISSNDYNPHWTTTKPLTMQVSDQATPRQTTFTRSSNSDREPPSGTRPSTPRNDTVEHSSLWTALTRYSAALRPASSSTHRRQKQVLPPRSRNQAGRPIQHALT